MSDRGYENLPLATRAAVETAISMMYRSAGFAGFRAATDAMQQAKDEAATAYHAAHDALHDAIGESHA